MKKLNMLPANSVTFEDGCNKYLDNCRQRNLREGTINHYKQSYTQFYKYFDAKILGHSSINTTRIYTMETGEIHRRQIQKLGLLRC